MATTSRDGEPALATLLKDVVDGLGTLVAGHLKLARVELEASAKTYGRAVGLIALAGALLLLGYALACIAGALALAKIVGAPFAFLIVGGVHLLAAGAALAVFLGRASAPPLGESLSELDHTVALLTPGNRSRNGHTELAKHGLD
jgi:Putative Actinobacterial Holin-X, holin superfamily III